MAVNTATPASMSVNIITIIVVVLFFIIFISSLMSGGVSGHLH